MKTLKQIWMLVGLATLAASIHAQEATVSSGGNASGAGGSVSYSVGQVVYTTNTGTTASVAQGVQQPYEISSNGIIEIVGTNIQFVAYPNPTMDNITLLMENTMGGSYSYSLIDLNGKALSHAIINDRETKIDLSKLADATYFLTIMNEKKELKTFKIIKNN